MDVNIYKNIPNNKNNPSSHKLYRCWASMKNRCYNENDTKNYAWYGDKGIRVCSRWLGKNGFWNFVKDMGERPDGYSLDRIDVNGDYCPENCRWASPKEQSYNRRNNLSFIIEGKKYNTEEAAKIIGVHPETLRRRRRKNFSSGEIASSKRVCRNRKKVVCLDTGEIFDSIASAAKHAGVADINISNCCRGHQPNGRRRLTAAGKRWCFLENEKEILKELGEML